MKTKVREKSELASNDPSDPWPYHSGISALYDNCDRIQAADRDDQQCSRDPCLCQRNSSLANFREAMEVTDFWHSLGNSVY